MEVEDTLDLPLRWGRPRLIFVNSMSDLFHEDLNPAYVKRVFEVMRQASRHVFQVLTKRTKYMCEMVNSMTLDNGQNLGKDPLENVWLGTSIEDEEAAQARSYWLAQTSAAVHFWSAEPLIGEIKWDNHLKAFAGGSKKVWMIFGGESQTGCRPMNPDWVRSGIKSCREHGIVPFVKQMGTIWAQANGASSRAGEILEEWPEDLRVREYPVDLATRLAYVKKIKGKAEKPLRLNILD